MPDLMKAYGRINTQKASKFARRHYQAIADVIAASDRDLFSQSEVLGMALRLADMLQADNPRFDRAKFLSACGV